VEVSLFVRIVQFETLFPNALFIKLLNFRREGSCVKIDRFHPKKVVQKMERIQLSIVEVISN